jgi:hypothetical protein
MDCADRIDEMMADLADAPVSQGGDTHATPLIVSPSHARAGLVKVTRLIPDIPLCVPASQEADYRKSNPENELIVHPDTIVGLSAKRQWLLDRYGDVFMLDDDVAVMNDLTRAPGESMRVTDPQVIRDLIYRLFDQAAQMGAHLLGFANFANPAAAWPHHPFELTGFVPGRAIGVRAGGKLFFPDRVLITDDLYVSALNAHFHRYCLRDCRYVFMAPGTWKNEGGMNVHRSWQRMLENNQLMIDLFGEAIVKKSGTKMAKIKHDAQLALRMPW